jgi:hypothetical protein
MGEHIHLAITPESEKIRKILVQFPDKERQSVNFKHFHRNEMKNGVDIHLFHQLKIVNHPLGIYVLYCPICSRFMEHATDKIEPLTQFEENGGWS